MHRRAALLFSFITIGLVISDCPGPAADPWCMDNDGDGYWSGLERRCSNDDCNDSDPDCHEGPCCPFWDCIDNDGDSYGEGPDCLGPDCDDYDAECHYKSYSCCTQLWPCLDEDGDGSGFLVCPGADCNDSDETCSNPRRACCMTGSVPCGTGLQCIRQCVDTTCFSDCFQNMDQEAQILYDNLQTCAAFGGCESDSGSNFWECASDRCTLDMDACVADQPGD